MQGLFFFFRPWFSLPPAEAGGGGGGGGSTATITNSNAASIALGSIEVNPSEGIALSSGLLSGMSVSTGGEKTPLLFFIKDLVTDTISNTDRSAQAVVGTMPDDCGDGDISIDYTETATNFSMELTFTNFNDCSSTTNGTITVEGSLTSMTMTFISFTTVDNSSGETSALSGTIVMTEESTNTYTVTMNVTLTENSLVYRIDDYIMTMTFSPSYDAPTFVTYSESGTFTDPEYGRVTIQTTEDFVYVYGTTNALTDGTLIVTGVDNTAAKLEIGPTANAYTVSWSDDSGSTWTVVDTGTL